MGFFQIGTFVGSILGSEIGQLLYNLSPRFPPILMMATTCLGIIPMWILIQTTPSSIVACSMLAVVGGTFAAMTGPNIRATLSNVTESRRRGLAFASCVLFDDVGKGAGPIAVVVLVRAYGRRMAFALSMLSWIPCAALCGLTSLTIVLDQRKAARKVSIRAGTFIS